MLMFYFTYLNNILGDKRVKVLLTILLVALCIFVIADHSFADTTITTAATNSNGTIEGAGEVLSNLLYNIIGKILFVVFIFGGIVMMWKSMAISFIMWGMAILLAFATGLSNEIWTMFH